MIHSTNYAHAFIEVAADCPAETGTVPPERAEPTVARLQYEMLAPHPYRFTSDDLLFAVHAARKGVEPSAAAREAFFSKPQACLRASPLAKSYGWGLHFDGEARVALYGRETSRYRELREDPALEHRKAMKSAR